MPSKPSPDRFLNYLEVAAMIGLQIATVKKGKCGTSEIPRIKLGGRVLFSFNAVQKWMERKAREAEREQSCQEMVVIDMLTEKRRRQIAVEKTMKTIINGGGKYSR